MLVELDAAHIEAQIPESAKGLVNIEALTRRQQYAWEQFARISPIPCAPGKEQAMSSYLKQFAKEHGLETISDEMGNILIEIEATSGYQNTPGIVFQTHQDIRPYPPMPNPKSPGMAGVIPALMNNEQGDWVTSLNRETSLGADNRVMLCQALSLIHDQKNFNHGKMAFLFTVQEEDGMKGASNLDTEKFQNIKNYEYFVNLDGEDEGEAINGSAGAGDTDFEVSATLEKSGPNKVYYEISLSDLPGGHSGAQIHEEFRVNAIKHMARILKDINGKDVNLNLVSINGGTGRNVIPADAKAVVAVDKDKVEAIQQYMQEALAQIVADTSGGEKQAKLEMTELHNQPDKVMTHFSTRRIIDLIEKIPNGVFEMSRVVPGLVQDSSNLSLIETVTPSDSNYPIIKLTTMTRSPEKASINRIRAEIESIAHDYEAIKIDQPEAYDGWVSPPDDKLTVILGKVYQKLFNKKLRVGPVHAGLENGPIWKKFRHLHSISFGPTIKNPHDSQERTLVPSVTRTAAVVDALIADILVSE